MLLKWLAAAGLLVALAAQAAPERLTLTGASTVAPLMADIAKRFEQANPHVRVDVQTGGSSRGVADARRGTADIGMVSRALNADEGDLTAYPIALDGVAMILHRDNPLPALTEEQIVAIYDISEAQAVKYLLRLDKIGFLELLPNNRVKLLVARTFAWIPNGPIHTYFKKEAYGDYLNSQFDGETELLRLVNVMLSKKSTAALLERLKQVAVEFSQQHQEDARLPGDERLAISFMLAARPWMPQTFKALLRQ